MQKEPAFPAPSLTEATAKDDLGRAESVRLVDAPLTGSGRRYIVERKLEQDGYAALQALVSDYLAQAAKLNAIPLASSPLERYLEHLVGA